MSYDEIIGTIGVGLLLIAYFCNSFSLVIKDGNLFFLTNVVGAGLACYAAWLIHYWPFVILEGTWCLVSIMGLVKRKNKTTPGNAHDS